MIGEFPKLDERCSFHAYDNGTEDPEFVLSTPAGRQFKLSPLAKTVLERLDGATSVETIADQLRSQSVPVSASQIRNLLEKRYAPLGVLEGGPSDAQPAAQKSGPLAGFPFLLKVELVSARWTEAAAKLCWIFFTRWAAAAMAVLIVVSHWAVYSGDARAQFSAESFAWILLMTLAGMLIHELGHASAVAHFGLKPGAVGAGLYLLMPTFFADVSEIWKLPRRQRVVVDLAGVYFQQMAFAAFAFAGWLTGRAEFAGACHLIDIMVFVALNPVFRFDGYWVLADWLAVPRLQQAAFRYVAARVRGLLGRSSAPAETPRLGGRLQEIVFRFYSGLSLIGLGAVVWIAARYVYSIFAQFPAAVQRSGAALADALGQGEFWAAVSRSLVLFFVVAFPATALGGITMTLFRAGGALRSRWLAARRSKSAVLGTPGAATLAGAGGTQASPEMAAGPQTEKG